MAEGAGEVDGRWEILDTRCKIKDKRLKIKDKRGEIYRTKFMIFEWSIISYPLLIIHQLPFIYNFFFFTK